MYMASNRRSFLKKATLSAVAATLIPEIVSAAFEIENVKRIAIKEGSVILFQGDSITDSGRDKTSIEVNNSISLGSGYPLLATAALLNDQPEKRLTVYNRGISGNKVYQLASKWEEDCLNLKPDVLSILVGVNDFWHTISYDYKGSPKVYRDDLSALLDKTKQKLPDVKLIIGEPFAVSGVKIVVPNWFPSFNEYQQSAKEIAEKYNAVFIPYQRIFDEAQKAAPGSYWTSDGIHPTLAGSMLMAKAWLKTIKKL